MADTLIPGGILAMTAQAADRLLKLDDGDAALLYLHCLSHGSAQTLNWPEARLRAAMDQLRGQGLAPKEAPPVPEAPVQEEPPRYDQAEINDALGDPASTFSALADEVERQLGKKLTPSDLKNLYTLYDHLALPTEVILMLVSWCVEEQERKYGPGRKPFLSQIKKEGFAWKRRGIDTMELAEAHLHRLTRLRSREAEVLRLLDIPARPLVQKEKDFVASWDEMGFEDEAIRMAYEKTVLQKQTMNWSYMNAILRSWHAKGLHTAAAIRAGDRDPRTIQAAAPAARPAPETESRRAREDMEWMRRLMDGEKKREE